MQKRYPNSFAYLEKNHLSVASFSHHLFSDDLKVEMSLYADKKLTINLSYSRLFGSLSYELHFPLPNKELEAIYDSYFPKEKSMFGRSSPSFRQAVIDYMRGQEHAPNPIKVTVGEDVAIVGAVLAKGRKDAGLLSGLRELSKTMRTGPLHNDVLFHLFA